MSAGFLNRRRCAQQMSHLNIQRVSLLMSGSSLDSLFFVEIEKKKLHKKISFWRKKLWWRQLPDVPSRIRCSLIKAELGKLSKALSNFPPLPLLQPLQFFLASSIAAVDSRQLFNLSPLLTLTCRHLMCFLDSQSRASESRPRRG